MSWRGAVRPLEQSERRPAISYEDGTLVDDPVTFSQAIGRKDSSRWYDAKEDMNSMEECFVS